MVLFPKRKRVIFQLLAQKLEVLLVEGRPPLLFKWLLIVIKVYIIDNPK